MLAEIINIAFIRQEKIEKNWYTIHWWINEYVVSKIYFVWAWSWPCNLFWSKLKKMFIFHHAWINLFCLFFRIFERLFFVILDRFLFSLYFCWVKLNLNWAFLGKFRCIGLHQSSESERKLVVNVLNCKSYFRRHFAVITLVVFHTIWIYAR